MRWTKPAKFLVALILSFSSQADCSSPIILNGDIVTMTERNAVIKGDVLISDTMIQEVRKEGNTWSTNFDFGQAKMVELGYILPGLINLHDHTPYNFPPLWKSEIRYDNLIEVRNGKL